MAAGSPSVGTSATGVDAHSGRDLVRIVESVQLTDIGRDPAHEEQHPDERKQADNQPVRRAREITGGLPHLLRQEQEGHEERQQRQRPGDERSHGFELT